MTDHNLTRVLFRTVKCGEFKGTVDAVFPDHAGDMDASTCACYAHIGQPGAGMVAYWQAKTRNATPQERAALERELKAIGYNLAIVDSFPKDSRRKRIVEMQP